MNWGKGLVLAYAAFISVVFIMISISISKNVDLVTEDYYDKEIKYQEEIDRINNTNILKEQVIFNIDEPTVKIIFPVKSPQSVISGEILFYRPSESRKDFSITISADNSGSQSIDISGISKGLWKVKVIWNMDSTGYLSGTSFIKQ